MTRQDRGLPQQQIASIDSNEPGKRALAVVPHPMLGMLGLIDISALRLKSRPSYVIELMDGRREEKEES